MIRLVMTYASETLAIKTKQEKKLDVAEMKTLRWSLGKTRKNKIRNSGVRAALGVRAVSEKVQGNRLRWFGQVERREPDYCVKAAEQIKIPGKRRRGTPMLMWKWKIKNDMKDLGLNQAMALDRELWRRKTFMADPTTNGTTPST